MRVTRNLFQDGLPEPVWRRCFFCAERQQRRYTFHLFVFGSAAQTGSDMPSHRNSLVFCEDAES